MHTRNSPPESWPGGQQSQQIPSQRGEEPGRCDWGAGSLEALVHFLVEHKAEAGDGGNFTEATWTKVAAMLVPYYVRGAVKTPKACRQKWIRVSEQYAVVSMIKNTSGLPWNEDSGVNLPLTNSVWEGFVARHPKARAYSNKGFPLYDEMSLLVRNKATGKN
ncbi:hypothetical protein K439DRAFT_1355590, partial [Ramaria rubella]